MDDVHKAILLQRRIDRASAERVRVLIIHDWLSREEWGMVHCDSHGVFLSHAALHIHPRREIRDVKDNCREIDTSPTDRNKSGLCSVTILLTRSSWHLKTRIHACRELYTVSRPFEEPVRPSSPISNTRTCLSPATVALWSIKGSKGIMAPRQEHSHSRRIG